MIVLLPPSETKHEPRRGARLALDALSFPELTTARQEVLTELMATSALPDACRLLDVSPGLADVVARNQRLREMPTAPAGQIYTGVLYDALDLATLDAAARARATRRLVVVSALFGALRMKDRIPPYRLAMGVSLPTLGALAAMWRPHLEPVLTAAAGSGLVIDGRSAAYQAAWVPRGDLAERWVHLRVPGVSHAAKHTRGLVARAVCRHTRSITSVPALARALEPDFAVTVHRPSRPGKGWTLDVTARELSPVSGASH